MRLRAVVAMALVLTIAPAVPALAEDSPAPPAASESASPANPPATPGDGTGGTDGQETSAPPPADATPPPPPPPLPKLEAGLASDDDGARVIVELAAPAEAAPVAGEARQLPDAEVVLEPADTSFIVVDGTGESLAKLAEDPRVLSIRRDRTYSPTSLGSEESAGSLATSLQVVGADKAHAAGTKGQGQTIAIIDTGIDAGHPDFGGKVVEQACFS
ncbi:hypothetical protein AB0C32_23850, partial [Streptosporangium sp. NPDC048865]